MRTLIIDNDPDAIQLATSILGAEGHDVHVTGMGAEGLQHARNLTQDLIILDMGLSDMAPSELVQQLRLAKVSTPILILSDVDKLVEVVRSLSSGANDYLTKPVRAEDLQSRINAMTRRAREGSPSMIRIGKLRIDLEHRLLEVDGRRVHLTGKEFAMLELLAIRRGTTVTKEMFLDHLYGGAYEPVLKIIDVFICKLRKKLAAACDGETYIETIWGRGYVLRDASEESRHTAARA
jgi:two-component system cell cycle response regulator CtrA